MAIYQFSHFHFDDSRGSLTVFSEEINSLNENSVVDESSNLIAQSDGNSTQPESIQLRNKVANLLTYLIDNNDRIISKEELLTELWQHGDYRENSLTQSIRELRSALGDNAKSPSYIKNYPQRGYQWIQVLTQIESSTTADEKEEIRTEAGKSDGVSHNSLSSSKENPEQKISYKRKYLIALFSVTTLILIILLGLKYTEKSFNDELTVEANVEVNSLLVLPFINATAKPSMAWLELGLADMLAIDLQRHDALKNNQLHVTPPASANALLVNAQLQWPALPVHIRSLLREHDMDAAIFASIRLHKEQQVFDFQIIYANGKTQQGSISYPSLPGALQAITTQLLHLINPKQNRLENHSEEEDPIASQALAQGMQALQQEGPIRAKKYFQATLLLEEKNQWARAYSARSSIALGQWQTAEISFDNIPLSAPQ